MSLPFPTPALVVSCQARVDNPLHGEVFMAAMARAAEAGGAKAIRANGPENVRAIRAATRLPIIGINKIYDDHPVAITPSLEAARAVAEAGADMIAIDATSRPRAGEPVADLIRCIHDDLKRPVLADVDTLETAIAALGHGADAIATTLAGIYRVAGALARARPGPAPPDRRACPRAGRRRGALLGARRGRPRLRARCRRSGDRHGLHQSARDHPSLRCGCARQRPLISWAA